ncbi:hypothetical protein [Micromonospora luteifusca]|uniref:hypothetical protein n=1 Tax=Micromonospora luteifusca TaxID=709860 RepID=UPI0033AD6A1B
MTTQHQHLAYGHSTAHGCLAFADAGTATEEAAEIQALAAARTWGEARQVQMTHLSNPAGPEYHEPKNEYADDRPFDITRVGAVEDGNWPPMVTKRAFTVLPQDLQDRYGKRQVTVHNGDYLEIAVAAEDELVAELRQRGYQVSRDDALINQLDGFSLGSPAA